MLRRLKSEALLFSSLSGIENEEFINTQGDEGAFWWGGVCSAPRCQDSSPRFCICERGFWDFKIPCFGKTGVTVLDRQPEA